MAKPSISPDTEDDCKQCSAVLEELEHIDDEAEAAEIPIVKVDDESLAKEVGVFAFPAVAFYKVGSLTQFSSVGFLQSRISV